ncbi:outer membrane protein [Acidicapsa ligni]|uniref:outer membrane protein n=1 Tax=Acidicapsa ligni TaxID=542300 RepID=UPI0021E079AF|nr:hypothetical protein [Acidicapsa ligni]
MKGKFLLLMFTAFASLLPVSLAGQVAKPTAPGADTINVFHRYDAFAGVDYSSANQVLGSSALIGFNVGADAKLKPWFGGVVDFGYYGINATSTTHASPTMTTVLAGPEVYIPADKLTGFFHVMFGGAHTGNVGTTPNVSFAYAIGGGLSYSLTPRWSARVSGDGILSSFVQAPSGSGESAHMRVNPRATLGVSYSF